MINRLSHCRCLRQDCDVCAVFNGQPEDLYAKTFQSKNQRLNQLLCSCPAISELYELVKRENGQTPISQHKKAVQGDLCRLVECGPNKLSCMKNIGELSTLAPRILCVQLTSGFSDFWTELRKVAKAVNKQTTLEAQLAALIAIRKHIPVGNPWKFYLWTDDKHAKQEGDILDRWSAALQGGGATTA